MPRRLGICHGEKDQYRGARFLGPEGGGSWALDSREERTEGARLLGPLKALTCIQFGMRLSQTHGDAKPGLVLLQHLKQLILGQVSGRRDGGRVTNVDENLPFR